MAPTHGNPVDHDATPQIDHAPPPPPSRQGSVVLDIGAGNGALVIHARAEQDGREIDVSPVGRPRHRSHAAVRPRHLPGATLHAAVISPLPRGLYTVWDGQAVHGIVAVLDGQVSDYRLT